MNDLLYILLTAIFFLLTFALLRLCDYLMGGLEGIAEHGKAIPRAKRIAINDTAKILINLFIIEAPSPNRHYRYRTW